MPPCLTPEAEVSHGVNQLWPSYGIFISRLNSIKMLPHVYIVKISMQNKYVQHMLHN